MKSPTVRRKTQNRGRTGKASSFSQVEISGNVNAVKDRTVKSPYCSIMVWLGILLAGAVSSSILPAWGQTQTDAGPPASSTSGIELRFYEGQKVSSVELAGRPDVNTGEILPLVTQRSDEPFSTAKIEESVAALKRLNTVQDVQVELRPEPQGVRVMLILQPAVYFGVYRFPGAKQFSYTRLLQVSNYASQEPYSEVDVTTAQTNLLTFLRQNGYFEAAVQPEIQTDKANGLANIDFHITLNRQAKVGGIQFTGTTTAEAQQLAGTLRSFWARIRRSSLREGGDYSLRRLQKAADYLRKHLAHDHHLAAQVRLVGANYDPQTNRADITFHVDAGPVVHVKVEGAHLWSWTRHSLLPVYQQSGISPESIEEGRQNLLSRYRGKGFFDAQVTTDVNENDGEETILYQIDKGPRKKITDVAFTGNAHFGKTELDQHVLVKRANLFSHGKYDEKSVRLLEAFYQSKGFNEVTVTPEFTTHGSDVVVTFAINEGPQDVVESLQVRGNTSFSLAAFAPAGLELHTGAPYAQKSIDDDRNTIMSHYLDQGYLSATFHASAQAVPGNPHEFRVIYDISEGPQVHTDNVVILGNIRSTPTLIGRQTTTLEPGHALTERELLASESKLYKTGVFDWAEVNPRRQITSQTKEDVVVKVHEAHRHTFRYGFGYEVVNRGGNVPPGAVALPGLPPVGLPSTFMTNQETISGPRVNFSYTRNNVNGKAATLTFGGLAGPLDRRLSFTFTDPHFRWSSWTANYTASGEYSKEYPTYTSRQALAGFQLQRSLNAKNTQSLILQYAFSETALSQLLIPELIPPEDQHTRLSTLSATYIRDTRDNALNAHKGMYGSAELDLNPSILGSSANFGEFFGQTAFYHDVHSGIIWANNLRLGFLVPTRNSRIPVSSRFYTGGGSTLRGFPLNGAGPQRTVLACGNPSDPSSCGLLQVPVGGVQLFIVNSELRIPVPLKKNFGFVVFYDGGNVYDPITFRNLFQSYTNSAGFGIRYSTPVGPIRLDFGHNLSPIPGIKATQIFLTLGQAF
jgi:outer membrane protein insertion porin family